MSLRAGLPAAPAVSYGRPVMVAWCDCNCADVALRAPGFQPAWLTGPRAEQRAIDATVGPLIVPYFAYHANGRHCLVRRVGW